MFGLPGSKAFLNGLVHVFRVNMARFVYVYVIQTNRNIGLDIEIVGLQTQSKSFSYVSLMFDRFTE